MHPAPSIRAAESSETKYTENLSTKELREQRRQFALQHSKITAFLSSVQKKKIRDLGLECFPKKSKLRDMENC